MAREEIQRDVVASDGHDGVLDLFQGTAKLDSDLSAAERAQSVANLIKAGTGEASMMARCTGKTDLHNIEPEDLRPVTLATARSTGIPLAGPRPG